MASYSERMFGEFEDLEDNDGNANGSSQFDEDDVVGGRLDAASMNPNDLRQEMERRGLQPKGFSTDDVKTLQFEFDKEHEQFVLDNKKKRWEAKQLAAKQARLQKRRMLMESQIQDEVEEIEKVSGKGWETCGCATDRTGDGEAKRK